MSALQTELARYRELLPSLTADEGKFALICGQDHIGNYASYEDALKIGYERFGLTPFLVKRIAAQEVVAHFTRDIREPCPT